VSEAAAAQPSQSAPVTPVIPPTAQQSVQRWATVPLRIRAIETLGLRTPLARVFRGSKYRMDTRRTIITRVLTEEGIVGEAYNGDPIRDGFYPVPSGPGFGLELDQEYIARYQV
jgi:L-alanine-DL-glutamate epimerase-like enolase superfamily enzyme